MGIKKIIKKCMYLYQLIGTKFLNILIRGNYDIEYNQIYKDLNNRNLLSPSNPKGMAKYRELYNPLNCYVPQKPYRIFAFFLEKNGIEGWKVISENIMANYISPILNPIGFRRFFEDKNVYGKLFHKEVLPKTVLRRMGGIFYTEDYKVIRTLNDQILIRYLNGLERVIVKPTIDSSSGRGVKLFIKDTVGNFISADNSSVKLTVEYLLKEYGNNLIIQECVPQSAFMATLNKDSVNTFRIGSYLSVKDNTPNILFIGIRMGMAGSYVDNTHAGGAKIRVNRDGKLAKYAVVGWGQIISEYNGVDFENNDLEVPNFDKIINLVKDLHSKIPMMRLVAFDVMLDANNNPRLIEYNISGFSTWLPQWTGQCVLGECGEEIINYCAKNKRRSLKVDYYIN